jgi:hypothetical protein
MSLSDEYREFLIHTGHLDLVLTCFRQSTGNAEAELVISATAFVAMGSIGGLVSEQYGSLLRRLVQSVQLKSDERLTGRLLGANITLLIGHLIGETTTGWRETLHILVERVSDRGGMSCLLAPESDDSNRPQVVLERPLLIRSHLEMAAMIEMLSTFTIFYAHSSLLHGRNQPCSFWRWVCHMAFICTQPSIAHRGARSRAPSDDCSAQQGCSSGGIQQKGFQHRTGANRAVGV